MRTVALLPDSARNNARATEFIKFSAGLVARKGNVREALEWARARGAAGIPDAFERALVNPGSTTDGTFGGPLAVVRPYGQAFLDLIRPKSVVGRMQAAFATAPFNVKVPRQTATTAASWVGEGQIVKLSRMALDSVTLEPTKLQGLVAFSTELAKFSSPAAEAVVEADLGATVIESTDTAFLDPTAAPTGANPGSITYGAPTVAASGATVAAFRADARNLVGLMAEAGAVFAAPFWVMSNQMLFNLDIGDSTLVKDGRIGQIPVLTTSLPVMGDGSSPDVGRIFLVDAAQVLMADGGLEVDTAANATVQMNDSPDSPEVATTVEVNLWQRNLVGVKTTRYVNWLARSAGVAGYISGASYG